MTFYQSFSGSDFDPVFPGSYDERIHNFRLPQEHRHSFHTYLPDPGSVASQNVDLNYYPSSSRNVPYPSISGETGFHIPYANHAAVPNRFQSGPWANMSNGETYSPMPPEDYGQLLNSSVNGCYNTIGNLVKPDLAFSSYSQPGHEYLFGCNAGWNQQSSDMGFMNSGNCMMAHPPQMQDRQFPAYWQSFQHKEIVNSENGDGFAVPRNCYIDGMVQNTVVSSAEHMCEDRNTFGIQPSFVDDTSIQRPTFSRYSPQTQPCDVLEPSLDSNTSLDTLLDITDLDTEDICDGELESTILQSLAEIPSLTSTRRIPMEVISSSSCSIMPPTNEVQASNIDTISTAACRFVSQAVPEVPQSGEKPVTATESINTSDEVCTAMEVTGCEQISSPYSSSPKQTSLGESSSVIISEVETSSSLSNAGISVTSTRMQFSDCQLQKDSSDTHSDPVILSELSVASKCATRSQELVPEVIIESDVGNCEPIDAGSSSSDDVIILSPSSSDSERTTPVSANVKRKVVKTQYCRVPPASITGHLTFDHQLHSVHRPVVRKHLPVRPPHAGSNTVRVAHHGSSASALLPLTYFGTCRNHDVLANHARHTANHCKSIPVTGQGHLSYGAVTAAQQASCSYAKPLFSKMPVTEVCTFTHNVPVRRYSAQMQQRSCLKASLKHSLSEPRTSNTALRTNNCCDNVASSQCTTLQKSLLQSSQASRHFRNAWHNNQQRVLTTSHNASSTVSHTPLAVRTNPKQSLFTNQKSYSLLRYSRDGSSLRLQDMSRRKNETYSVRAASILLQRIKQAKLLEITSAHAARQHLLHRRLNSVPQNREVVDLTGDDDDGGEAYTADTCEFVFTQTRRRRTRMPLLHRPRPYFHRTGTLADISSCDRNFSMKKTFAVDKSLPFYRCFVQNLLRNFRFTSSGVPVKVWYQEILPPAVPNRSFGNGGADSPECLSSPAQNFEENSDMSETEFSKICTKELMMKRQPVVLLKRLDQSELNNYGVFTSSAGNEIEKCVDDAVSESDDASPNLQLEESEKYTETGSENVSSSDHGQENIMADEIERENVEEEKVSAKQTEPKLRLDKLLALCRPVSVVLEHLDRIKIRHIGKELCTDEPCSQNKKSIFPTGSGSVSDFSWTVTQIPRANKVPILVMRVSSFSALNASRKKVTKKAHPACRLRSNFRCLRTRGCNAGIRRMHNLTPDSIKFTNSHRSILKKIPACRKLHFPTSVWGSKNAGHVLRRQLSASEERSPCRISSKCRSQQSKSQSTVLVKRPEDATKTYSISAKPICKLERFASSVEHLLPSDSTPTNSLTNSIPHDFVVNQTSPEHCRSSDANYASDQAINSGTSDAFPKSLPATDSLPKDTNDLREDYASSGSNTVVMSPCSSTDDLTIAYRSPLSDVFDDDDLTPDQQENSGVSLEAGNGSEEFDVDAMDVVQELKHNSYSNIGEVAPQPCTAIIPESAVQSFSSLVKLSTFSTQFSCGTATSNALNTRQLQPTPVMLIESVNGGLQQRPAVNSLSEFVDEDRSNVRWLYPSLQRLS